MTQLATDLKNETHFIVNVAILSVIFWLHYLVKHVS
jgi:hypothetical protein